MINIVNCLVGTPGSKRGYSGAPVLTRDSKLAAILLGSVTKLDFDSSMRECVHPALEQQSARILIMPNIYLRLKLGLTLFCSFKVKFFRRRPR